VGHIVLELALVDCMKLVSDMEPSLALPSS
jgi:hypothetical protein